MAESTVRSLERQLETLQKIYAAQLAGGFPQIIVTFGDQSFEDAIAEKGIDYPALQELGINIRHLALPWLKTRRISYGDTLPMSGSEPAAGMSIMGAV